MSNALARSAIAAVLFGAMLTGAATEAFANGIMHQSPLMHRDVSRCGPEEHWQRIGQGSKATGSCVSG